MNKTLVFCGEEKEINPLVCCPNFGEITEKQCEEYGKGKVEVHPLLNSSRFVVYPCKQKSIPLIVVGEGTDADPGEFPHMALLGYGTEDKKSWLCGGSLISHQHVLTAAHCSYDRVSETQAQWVRLGEHDKSKNMETNRVSFNIKKFIKYPLYEATMKYHDIAIILLDKKVTFTNYIRPACLNTAPTLDTNIKLIATGWGALGQGANLANILQQVKLQQFTRNECQKSYNDQSSLRRLPNGITDSLICVGDTQGKKDTCGGDSGGPLQIYHPKVFCTHSIVGVTAFGKNFCGQPGIPGVYTKVYDYIEWIENIVWI